MSPLVLVACFSPLIAVWIVMKLSVWIAAIGEEQIYVKKDAKRPHGPYLANPYADVDEEDEEYGDKTDYR